MVRIHGTIVLLLGLIGLIWTGINSVVGVPTSQLSTAMLILVVILGGFILCRDASQRKG